MALLNFRERTSRICLLISSFGINKCMYVCIYVCLIVERRMEAVVKPEGESRQKCDIK